MATIGSRGVAPRGRLALLGLAMTLPCGLTKPARAEVSVEKSLEFDELPGLGTVTIDHPLGSLEVRGWRQKGVRITAVKRAPDAQTLRRLRVTGSFQRGAMRVETRVLMDGASVVAERELQRIRVLLEALDGFRRRPKPWDRATRAAYEALHQEVVKLQRGLVAGGSGATQEVLRAVPVRGAEMVLRVFIPAGVSVTARTLHGDIDAADLAGRVELSSRRGRIFARNVKGEVRSRTESGHQFITTVTGPVSVDGYAGDLRLQSVSGRSVQANLLRGEIVASQVRAPTIRLTTTQGGITLHTTLVSGGRIELRTRQGAIDLRLAGKAPGYHLDAETRAGVLRLPSGPGAVPSAGQRRIGRVRGGSSARIQLVTGGGDITVR